MLRTMAMAAGLAVALAAAGTSGAFAQKPTVKAGIDAWQRSDYAAAVAIWRPLAEAGDADAAFNLGQAYRLGRGVPLNLPEAQDWLERAARKDHLDAQATLGLLLFQNNNHTGGLRWLKMAAERGEPRALLVYGTALYNGDGVVRDPVLAYAYVSRAAAQGLQPAKNTLAELDKLLPLDIRQKGIALAQSKAAAAPAPLEPTAKPRATRKPVAPAAAPAKAAAPATGGSGPWRIQLGAFAQRGSAEALFRRLGGALGGKQAYYVPAGNVTRLQVGPYPTRAAAASACAALKGQACFPVAAK